MAEKVVEVFMGRVHSISVSSRKGVQKTNTKKAFFESNHGIVDDAHAGKWHRQISLLAQESIDKMVAKGLKVKSGDFAENITTEGVDLMSLPIGTSVKIGDVVMTISQLGKLCHHKCAVYHKAGDCVMPREGIFAVVNESGEIKEGDEIEIIPKKGFSVAIITLSDRASRGEYEDGTGPEIEKTLKEQIDCAFVRREIIADEQKRLELMLIDFIENQKFDLIVTNGSTGVSPRDIAPEAILSVIEKRLPGFEEAMRMEGLKKTINAIISRAVCGVRKDTLVISLPGSPKGAVENLMAIIKAVPHAITKIHGDDSNCARL